MEVKHDSFPVVLWRVPIGSKVYLFPELNDWEVQHVDFFELVVIAVVGEELGRAVR